MGNSKSFTGGRKYSNDDITVYWKPSACIHATYCFRELIEVFDPGRRPWVDMKAAPTEKIIEVVNLCPTDALTWKWNDKEKNRDISPDQTNHVRFRRPELMEDEVSPADVKPVVVKVMVDGPVVINGSFEFCNEGASKEMKESLVSMCRCGGSNKMPFCDGNHRKLGFTG